MWEVHTAAFNFYYIHLLQGQSLWCSSWLFLWPSSPWRWMMIMQTWASRSANVFTGIFIDKLCTGESHPLEGARCFEHLSIVVPSKVAERLLVGRFHVRMVKSWKNQLFLIKIIQNPNNMRGLPAKTRLGNPVSCSWLLGSVASKGVIKNNTLHCP